MTDSEQDVSADAESSSEEGGQQLRIGWDPAAPPAPATYANYAQATFTPEDFTVLFGWYAAPALREPPPDGVVNALVQPVARVTLPLNLMKNVVALLQRQIEGYEQSFGEIPDHPNRPPWMQQASAEQEEGAAT